MDDKKTFDYQMKIAHLKEHFEFDFVALALVQSAELRYELKWEYAVGNRSNRFKRIVLQSGKGIAGNVFKSGKPMFVADVAKDLGEEDLFNYPIIVAEGLSSFGAIPLYKYNRVKGVLICAYRDEPNITEELFQKVKTYVGPRFGPFYNKEMLKL